MTCVLLVDDDPRQLRLLARAFDARGSKMSVLTAANGTEAIQLLETRPIDLVLTDLQMPNMNGFELLAWLLSNRPQVTVFTMTAYPDADSMTRLQELGSVECFTKPLDIGSVLAELGGALESGVSGQIRNISLASMLQLIEMERKTCTLVVTAKEKRGTLFIYEGVLIDATTGELVGDEAVISVLSWKAPSISISGVCRSQRRTVEGRVSFMVMEAMRRLDEAERIPSEPPPPPKSELPLAGRSASLFPPPEPTDAEAFLFVEAETGRIRSSTGAFPKMGAIARLVAELHRNQLRALAPLGHHEVDEVAIATDRYWALASPISEGASLAMVLFDPNTVNVVMARMELRELIKAFLVWKG